MKRTILALGAAAALGIAGTSHAVVYFGYGDHEHLDGKDGSATPMVSKAALAPATQLANYAGGVGHMLFAPYFTVQDANQTIFTIVNTDEQNGKAVKVRLRSAGNSDDLLDFTLLLSPGDVWSASLTQNSSGVLTLNPNGDTTCTLPAMDQTNGWSSGLGRLPQGLDADVLAGQSREGYIEVLSMADIPPLRADGTTNPLFTSIKHALQLDGSWRPANCNSDAVNRLTDTNAAVFDSMALVNNFGLSASSGGLFGSWWILNQADLASFSGAMTAIRAEYPDPADPNATLNGWANVTFAPQMEVAFAPITVPSTGAIVNIGDLTADVLLQSGALQPMWYDLPDMSTPILEATPADIAAGKPYHHTPEEQVAAMGLTHGAIMNEFTAAPDYDVPMTTDWVVSQPTRRYYAVVNYNAVPASRMLNWGYAAGNPYASLVVQPNADGVPLGCIGSLTLRYVDREERGSAVGAVLSGGAVQRSCGEVFTINFGGRSMLRAKATATNYDTGSVKAGWARAGAAGVRLPLLGFAATAALNETTKVHYDTTYPHRWSDD